MFSSFVRYAKRPSTTVQITLTQKKVFEVEGKKSFSLSAVELISPSAFCDRAVRGADGRQRAESSAGAGARESGGQDALREAVQRLCHRRAGGHRDAVSKKKKITDEKLTVFRRRYAIIPATFFQNQCCKFSLQVRVLSVKGSSVCSCWING